MCLGNNRNSFGRADEFNHFTRIPLYVFLVSITFAWALAAIHGKIWHSTRARILRGTHSTIAPLSGTTLLWSCSTRLSNSTKMYMPSHYHASVPAYRFPLKKAPSRDSGWSIWLHRFIRPGCCALFIGYYPVPSVRSTIQIWTVKWHRISVHVIIMHSAIFAVAIKEVHLLCWNAVFGRR